MKELFAKKADCCGCAACENICQQGAISMQEDSEGFLYPVVDAEKCIECGLCDKVCPEKNLRTVKDFQEKCYAGYSRQPEEVKNSASGGLATALACGILERGGYVYGVAYDSLFEKVLYVRAHDTATVDRFRGSKYVQAIHERTYSQIKHDLENGETVLFIGLPCEANALSLFLKKQYDKLYVCSLICHGPTSQKVHRQFIERIKSAGKDISFFTVRHKIDACKPYYIRAIFSDGNEKISRFDASMYGKAFRFMKRPSCNQCTFKRGNVHADVTIGDFHYGYALKNEINNPMGISNAIVHTPKGEQLLQMLKDFSLWEVPLDQCLHNEAYIRAVPEKPNRREFGRVFSTNGLEKACSLASVRRVEKTEKLRASFLTFLVRMKRRLIRG